MEGIPGGESRLHRCTREGAHRCEGAGGPPGAAMRMPPALHATRWAGLGWAAGRGRVSPRHDRWAFEHQRRVELHRGGAGPELGVRIGAAAHSTGANQRDPALGESVHVAQRLGGQVHERGPAQPSGLALDGALQRDGRRDGYVGDDDAIRPLGQAHDRDVYALRGSEVGRHLEDQGSQRTQDGGIGHDDPIHPLG
eukprot:scaffold29538_cov120-Isochrysis_galbana.AAC.3